MAGVCAAGAGAGAGKRGEDGGEQGGVGAALRGLRFSMGIFLKWATGMAACCVRSPE